MRRRAGESFLVGENIEIEILEVCGTRVKIGIVAPESVIIQRKETQLTRDETLVAARSMRNVDFASLLGSVAVNGLTAPASLTPIDPTVPAAPKKARSVPALPDMTH